MIKPTGINLALLHRICADWHGVRMLPPKIDAIPDYIEPRRAGTALRSGTADAPPPRDCATLLREPQRGRLLCLQSSDLGSHDRQFCLQSTDLGDQDLRNFEEGSFLESREAASGGRGEDLPLCLQPSYDFVLFFVREGTPPQRASELRAGERKYKCYGRVGSIFCRV